jgi:hypothetical protein
MGKVPIGLEGLYDMAPLARSPFFEAVQWLPISPQNQIGKKFEATEL